MKRGEISRTIVDSRRGKQLHGARQHSENIDATMRTHALSHFKALVSGLGGDPLELLRSCQIEPSKLDGAEDVVSYSHAVKLLELASVALECPDFGMRLAAAQAAHDEPRILGALDIAMRNAPTLGEAYRYCADHVHSYSKVTRIGIEKLPDDRRVFMLFEIAGGWLLEQRRQAVEHALAVTQYAIRSISGGQARAKEVWFTHEPLAPMSSYRANFNATVRFGQSLDALLFDESDFALSLPGADPQLYEIATSFIDQRFPAAAMPLSARVRFAVARLLVEGKCTHEYVAAALGLHLRTLQRRLREEGESFESIRDNVRRDLALRYLQQPHMSLVKLTEILGYSETSVLSRSCHRWFSASPRKLRNALDRQSRKIRDCGSEDRSF
jgi:AraC-like DNA-binding protein